MLRLSEKEPSSKEWIKRLGMFLIILSFFLYSGLLLIPFIPYNHGSKMIISSILVIFGEVAFWVGGLILGKEIIMKYKQYFNPVNWFKKNS